MGDPKGVVLGWNCQLSAYRSDRVEWQGLCPNTSGEGGCVIWLLTARLPASASSKKKVASTLCTNTRHNPLHKSTSNNRRGGGAIPPKSHFSNLSCREQPLILMEFRRRHVGE